MNLSIYGLRRFSNRRKSLLFILGRLDISWFIALMMWKLIWFDTTLSIWNVAMNVSDFFVALGAVLIITGWMFWLSPRWRTLSLLALNILLTTIIFADLVYFRYFQDFISVPVLLQAGQVSSLGESVVSLIHIGDIWLFMDWIVVIPLSIIYFRTLSQKRKEHRVCGMSLNERRWLTWIKRLLQSSLCFIIGTWMIAVPVYQAAATGIFAGNWSNVGIYNITGLFGFHGYDVYRYAKDNWLNGGAPSQETMNEVQQWFHNHRSKLKGPPVSFGKYKGSNVIIVQAEAFENFVIGKSFNGQEITPHMNKLLKESMYFNRFFHQTGQGRTSDADLGVNASLHPLPTGSVFARYPNHRYDTLPALLQRSSYTTRAYHAYEASFWNRYVMYGNMGYDEFISLNDYKMDESLGWSLGDKSFLRQSVAHMAGGKLPFYSFLITLTSHHPYKLSVDKQKLNVEPYQNTIFGDYLQSIHYVDEALGEMIQDLKQRGLWDKTIWIMYGDHDNSINESDEREPLARILGHDISDFDRIEMKNQVPLIIHLPDGANVGIYHLVSGQLDIAPTILYWLGIDTVGNYFMGQNLLNPADRLIVLRNGSFNRSFTNGNVFYVPSVDGRFEHGTCYDYGTRKPTDVVACKPFSLEAQRRLDMSELVIMYNLIGKFRIDSP